MDRGAWQATVHGVGKSQTILSATKTTTTCIIVVLHRNASLTWNSHTSAYSSLLPLLPKSLTASHLFTVSILLPFPECHSVAVVPYVAFSDWLLSLSNMHLKLLCVFLWLDSPFLFSAE